MSSPEEDELFPVIGERVREARGNRGQSEFAAQVNLSVPGLSRLETSGKAPKLQTLVRIAKETGRSLDWYVGLSDESQPKGSYSALSSALEEVRRATAALRIAESALANALSETVPPREILARELASFGLNRAEFREQYSDGMIWDAIRMARADRSSEIVLRSMAVSMERTPGSVGKAARTKS